MAHLEYINIIDFLTKIKEEKWYYSIVETTSIFSGSKNINLHYDSVQQISKKFAVSYYIVPNVKGGTLVLSKGDLFIAGINQNNVDWYINTILNFFKTKNINCKFLGNDFVIYDLEKIGSTFYGEINHQKVFGIWFNNSINQELINQVCFNVPIKTPTALSTYGINPIEILDYIQKQLT